MAHRHRPVSSLAQDQSLEDMLKLLEGTNTAGGYQEDDGINNIDEFLNQLEADTAAPPSRGNRITQLIDDFDELDLATNPSQFQAAPPPKAAPKPSPFTKQAAPAPKPAAPKPPAPAVQKFSAAPVQSLGGGALVNPEGERMLLDEGYTRHTNKGKFVNYSRGKATDFRIKGTTSSRVGLIHVITLRALDDNCEPCQITEVNPRDFIGATLTLLETGRDIQPWYKDNGDATYDIAFYAEHHGTVELLIKLAGSPMFDIQIQVDPSGDSLWAALLQNQDVKPHDLVVVAIVTTDDSRPEGVVPFEVQTMGDVSDLRLTNNGDGTYRFQCVPQSNGHCTINITLHEQPIRNSPVTFKVGGDQRHYVKQVATQHQPARNNNPGPRAPSMTFQQQQPTQRVTAPAAAPVSSGVSRNYGPQQGGASTNYGRPPTVTLPQETFYEDQYEDPDGYEFEGNEFDANPGNVTNDDLNRLLDELGGGL